MKLGLGIFFLLVGLLVLLMYPIILLADVMSLAGDTRNGPVPFAAQAFLYSSLAYPLVYVPCVLGWFILRRLDRQDVALRVSGIPLFYLLILAVEFAAWASVQRPIHP